MRINLRKLFQLVDLYNQHVQHQFDMMKPIHCIQINTINRMQTGEFSFSSKLQTSHSRFRFF